MAASALAVMSPDGGLSRYLSEIRKFPMLAKDEEFMLAKAWQEHEDPEAAHRLVTSLLQFEDDEFPDIRIVISNQHESHVALRRSPTYCGGSVGSRLRNSCSTWPRVYGLGNDP